MRGLTTHTNMKFIDKPLADENLEPLSITRLKGLADKPKFDKNLSARKLEDLQSPQNKAKRRCEQIAFH